MKLSKIMSVITFFGVAIIVGNSVYKSRKRAQEKADLRYAIEHPLRAIDVLKSHPIDEDKVLSSVLSAGHSTGHHLTDWAKRKLQKHISDYHSN